MGPDSESPQSSLNNIPQQRPHRCGVCNRTYARVDHLSRHLRSHLSEKPYICEICFKSFSRPDLLKRHAEIHTRQKSQKRSKRQVSQACKACAATKVKCKEEKPCLRCQQKGIHCEYVNPESRINTTLGPAGDGYLSVPQQDPRLATLDPPLDTLLATSVIQGRDSDFRNDQIATELDFIPDAWGSQGNNALDGLDISSPVQAVSSSSPVFDFDDSALAEFLKDVMMPGREDSLESSQSHSGIITPVWGQRDLLDFGLYTDAEFSERDYDILNFYHGRRDPTLPCVDSSSNFAIRSSISDQHGLKSPLSSLALGAEAFRKSLWCWNPTGQDPSGIEQTTFTTHPEEASRSDDGLFAGRMHVIDETLGSEVRDKIIAMILGSCDRSNFPKMMACFPSADLLDNLMHSFLAYHLAQLDSWIHVSTLKISDQTPEFVGSLISDGALLSTSPTIRKLGLTIQQSVRLSIPKLMHKNNALSRDLGIMQALVLDIDVGLWCGNKRWLEISEGTSQPVVTMCRRASRFLRSNYETIIPLASDEGAELENKWRRWVRQESFKRLVFHIFIRDAQVSISFLVNTSISYAELSLPLPECRRLWLAKSASEWKEIYLSKEPELSNPIPALTQCIHNLSPLIAVRDRVDGPLCASVIYYGIWGLVLEYRRLNSIIKAHDPPHLANGVLILGYRHQELCQLLNQLDIGLSELKTVGGLPVEAKLLRDIMFMHLHMSFEDIQLFAGKEREEEARRVYPGLQQWVASRDARQALWHAGQVIKALKQLHPHRVRDFNAIAVYHASLAFWAYGVLSVNAKTKHKVSARPGDEELVWLDGEENPGVKRFIEFRTGLPCFAIVSQASQERYNQSGTTITLSDPGGVMIGIIKLLKGSAGSAGEARMHLPPLVENLCGLMTELGNAARVVVGKN